MTPIEALLTVTDAFTASRKLSEARISTIIFKDGKRLKSVREGADIGGRLIARGLQWFSDHWPSDAQWPSDVARPAQSVPAQEVAA